MSVIAISSSQGAGKAQPIDSLVLTPQGWIRIGQLKVGDQVIAVDGKPSAVMGVFPQGLKEVVKVTCSGSAQAKACVDHLWQIECHSTDSQLTLPLGEPSGSAVVTSTQLMELVSGKSSHHIVSLPVVAPVEFENSVLNNSVPPYEIGCRMGDYLSGGIPVTHMLMSIEYRWELLRGILDTMGTVHENSRCVNIPVLRNGQFAVDIEMFARSLGCIVVGQLNESPLYAPVSWNITITARIPAMSTKLPHRQQQLGTVPIDIRNQVMSVVQLPDLEECVCISIDHPSKLYVTNDFIITHNTTILTELAQRGYTVVQRKTSRSILNDWNVSLLDVNNSSELLLKFQEEVLSRKLKDDFELDPTNDPNTVVFTERSFVDLFTYCLIAIGADNNHSDWLDQYYRKCLAAQQRYTRVYYLTAGHFKVQSDGVRGDNRHYSKLVDLTMRFYYDTMTSVPRRQVIETPFLDDRLDLLQCHYPLPKVG